MTSKKPSTKTKATSKQKAAPKATTRRRPGAPSKFDTHAAHLITLVAAGVSLTRAAKEVGIDYHTLRRWRQRGEDAHLLISEGYKVTDEDERYAKFRTDLERACERVATDAEVFLGEVVRKARKGERELDVRDALSILERLDRTRWGQRIDVTVDEGPEAMLERYADTIAAAIEGVIGELGLTDEQRERLPEALERHLLAVTAKGET